MIFQIWNVAWNKFQFKVYQAAQVSVAYLDKHSTLDLVMVCVANSIPSGGRQLKFFKPLDVNARLKNVNVIFIVKNSNGNCAPTVLALQMCIIITWLTNTIRTVQGKVTDPGFPRWGAPTSKVVTKTIISSNFPQKLHENKRILTGGSRVPGDPLDPPLRKVEIKIVSKAFHFICICDKEKTHTQNYMIRYC